VAAAEGSGPPVGTRVVFLANWGSWSELVAVPTHRVAPIPDDVSFAQAAALPVAGLTALRALRSGGPVLHRRVLVTVTGASGGIGHFAVQLAQAAGGRVTALVSGLHRIDVIRELGIEDTEVGGGPFDLVVDGVGGQVLVEAVEALRQRQVTGKVVLAGG
jgi:NADPH2:quinone reductase